MTEQRNNAGKGHGEGNRNSLRFEPSAYLQRLLGRELISNEFVAIGELVKNAYDAGATIVRIVLSDGGQQTLTISDNGRGMSLDEFRRVWMTPGYTEKPVTPSRAGRPLLGEKGIGRFASDKLASELLVITKKHSDANALHVRFDWAAFDKRELPMRDVDIPYTIEPTDAIPRHQSGTVLVLSQLRTLWSAPSWKRLRKELQNLVTPYKPVKEFRIEAFAEGLDSGPVSSTFESQPGYRYSFALNKGGKLTRILTRPLAIAKELSAKSKEETSTFVGSTSFGPMRGVFYYVDRPRQLRVKGFEPGISLYRDGFRVEPFGREYDDWLEVKEWKASRHGHAPINPTRLFGFVEISLTSNPALRDVTNREGLIENTEFREFKSFVMENFKLFAETVGKDKEQLDLTSPAYSAQQESQARIVKALTFAEISGQLAHQLRQPLQVVESEAGNVGRLLELDQRGKSKDIEAALRNIRSAVEDIDGHIRLMEDRAKSSAGAIVSFDLVEYLKTRLAFHLGRAAALGVELVADFPDVPFPVTFSRETLNFVLDVLVVNAISACELGPDGGGAVTISLTPSSSNSRRVTVTDSGPGIPEAIKDRVLQEVVPSAWGGRGFGLMYARDSIETLGGRITYGPLASGGTSFYVEFSDKEPTNA